ncbi:metal-sulfur cluster assembly factor [Candidatus Microgenomates bacterium]|nr:MAG: metal-sulfur cluster assembly factor [Candidatus Microgenomates bacterium]
MDSPQGYYPLCGVARLRGNDNGNMLTQDDVMVKIKPILDPELGISIVDLGLIYGVEIGKDNVVTVHMTLTTIGCPLFSLIAEPIKGNVKELEGVKDVVVELSFEPAWTPERMSEEAKIQLGFV